jgi:tetratricopeptide (TPR) repeat protein
MKNLFVSLLLFIYFPAFAENSDSSIYYFNKAVTEQNASRYLVASQLFEKAIKFDPAFKEAFLQNGLTNLAMHNMDHAMELFKKVLVLEPRNAIAVKELADLYLAYHQYDKAIALAQTCPGCSNADKILGISNFHLENFELAVKSLQSFIKKNPTDAEAYYMAASSYLGLEQHTEAAKFYQKAIELDNAKVNWMNELGLLYYQTDDFKNAVVYFNKAKEKGFLQTSSFTENLAYAYLFSGDFETGEKLLMEIWKKKPGNKDILRDLADEYYKKKMYDKSLDFCQKILEMDMKDGKAMYQAGMCFQKKGQTEKGQALCDKAIQLDPSLAGMRKQQMMGAGL